MTSQNPLVGNFLSIPAWLYGTLARIRNRYYDRPAPPSGSGCRWSASATSPSEAPARPRSSRGWYRVSWIAGVDRRSSAAATGARPGRDRWWSRAARPAGRAGISGDEPYLLAPTSPGRSSWWARTAWRAPQGGGTGGECRGPRRRFPAPASGARPGRRPARRGQPFRQRPSSSRGAASRAGLGAPPGRPDRGHPEPTGGTLRGPRAGDPPVQRERRFSAPATAGSDSSIPAAARLPPTVPSPSAASATRRRSSPTSRPRVWKS